METKKVGFASGFGFVLAAAGSAIGLGNLWAFPYKTAKNGGAAFVLIYVACVLLIGLVTMLTEIFIGRRAQANPITAYKKIHKNIGWMGLLAIIVPAFITCYYSVLGGWTLKYTVNSFQGNAGILAAFSTNTVEVIVFTCLFVFLALAVIAAGVETGIEKMSKILMPLLFIILVAIVIYSLTLGEGVKEGLAFYLKPDFSSLTPSAVLAAMAQAFYSLSLGMGIMMTYGSYTHKEINIVKSMIMICVFDTVVALLAGLAIFPAVAHFNPALLDGSKGVALIYIILPEVFESMGVVGRVISFFFFAMVTIAAMTSIMSLYEVCTQFVLQKFKVNRKKSAIVVGLICLIVSIPVGYSLGHVAIMEESSPTLFGLDWLTFFDEVTNTVLMPVCAFFSCFAVGWVLKPEKAIKELKVLGSPVPEKLIPVYSFFVRYLTPLLILIIEVGGVYNEIKSGNIAVVVFSLILVVFSIVAYFLFFRDTYTGTNEDEIENRN